MTILSFLFWSSAFHEPFVPRVKTALTITTITISPVTILDTPRTAAATIITKPTEICVPNCEGFCIERNGGASRIRSRFPTVVEVAAEDRTRNVFSRVMGAAVTALTMVEVVNLAAGR